MVWNYQNADCSLTYTHADPPGAESDIYDWLVVLNGISFAVAKSQRLFSVEDPSVQSDDDEDRTMTMPISAQFVQTDWFQADVVNERVNGALRWKPSRSETQTVLTNCKDMLLRWKRRRRRVAGASLGGHAHQAAVKNDLHLNTPHQAIVDVRLRPCPVLPPGGSASRPSPVARPWTPPPGH